MIGKCLFRYSDFEFYHGAKYLTSREEHYAMYRDSYDKRLCHAWSVGTLYFVEAYLAGVRPTAPCFAQFEVSPETGMVDFRATVPINGGAVRVVLTENMLEVYSDKEGGSLVYVGKKYKLEAAKKFEMQI